MRNPVYGCLSSAFLRQSLAPYHCGPSWPLTTSVLVACVAPHAFKSSASATAQSFLFVWTPPTLCQD